jgi:nucleoside phosphorylase
MKAIGLVIPTRWEAAELRRRHRFTSEKEIFRGRIGDRDVLFIISGVGAELARAAAYRLCAAGVSELVSFGYCGALVPGLAIGTVLEHRITSVDYPVKTEAERRALAEKASAVAVDMETQAVVEAGTRRGLPVRMLRVVSDRFEDDLTPLMGNAKDFSYLTIALRLLNPAVWPLARRLRAQSHLAATHLTDALERTLREN